MTERVEWAVPRSIDDTPRVLFLDLHQLVLILVPAGAGIMLGSMLAGMAAGALLAKAYGSLRANRHPCIVKHLAYWYLPPWVVGLRCSPPAHRRLYVG